MKLRDAIAMLIFFAIYTPLSVLIWYIFKLPEMAMILIFLLGVVYAMLYLLLAILMTPPKKPIVKRIDPEIIEVKEIKQIEQKPRKKAGRKDKTIIEPKDDSQKEEVAKPKRKYKKRKSEQKVVVPNSREEEAETFTAPEELPLPFSSPEETNDLD